MQTPTKLAPTLGAIKPRYLNDAIKDTRSRLYPGTVVIASLTGESWLGKSAQRG